MSGVPVSCRFLFHPQSYSLPYQSTGECRNRSTEYLSNNLCCSKCKPGTRKLSGCSEERDTACGVCPHETYSDNLNYYANCFSCTKCQEADKGMEYTKRCSRDSNAVCVCKPGWYCVLNEDPCSSCERHRKCPPGHGASILAVLIIILFPLLIIIILFLMIIAFPFSSYSSSFTCLSSSSSSNFMIPTVPRCLLQERLRRMCELQGRTVLIPGTVTADAVCGPVLSTIPSRVTTFPFFITSRRRTSAPTELSTKPPVPFSQQTSPISFSVSSTQSQVQTSLVLWIALLKPAVHHGVEAGTCINPDHLCSPAENHVLLADSSSDPSTSLSSDSHSQGTGVSQDCLHVEQPSVTSPVVNLSFTATINYQVNPATGCCSIPISPCMQPPEPEFPLSQEEELCVSSEQEDSKDAIQSVQESGMTKC
ncbi:Tumor necrosis factor receptor superfamily member 1B [Bagarius yarrelli]|uniref:Tumor necrosis factor receptor superfamily member 1B n=1 Tax=Bagarius yarrelli TaxID=175774 RepID=A0A556V4H7_BAGYA|nr:Tumor necrosis factor receptor superfamily member 1B [Bagarius yarrelli]